MRTKCQLSLCILYKIFVLICHRLYTCFMIIWIQMSYIADQCFHFCNLALTLILLTITTERYYYYDRHKAYHICCPSKERTPFPVLCVPGNCQSCIAYCYLHANDNVDMRSCIQANLVYRVAQKNGTVDFWGLCSDQQLSIFTLLDRASFPHYNNTKIIIFGWELFILWIISYGLSFSGFARFPEFRGTINDTHYDSFGRP